MGKTIPGGSGGMLRSRRRDINVKPNRVLDRNSTRGMIYENEELRLRTININEEIEKGQSDIKKLRRENDHLRREIWTLREECDRLQELLTQQDEAEEEEEEDEEEDDDGEEEDEDGSQVGEEGNENKEASGETDKLLGVEQIQIHHHEGDGCSKKLLKEVERLSVVPEEPEEASSTEQNDDQITPANKILLTKEAAITGDTRVDEFKRGPTPCLRINSIHPFTAAATIDSQVLPNLMVCELIEAIRSKCLGIVGVRLLYGCLYVSCDSKTSLDALLSATITIRDIPLSLHDVSQGTIVVAMTGVPHHLTDADLAHVLGQFGPVIGGVERRLYRDVDTGERLARIRPVASIPKRLFLQGSEILLRLLSHEELAKMTIHTLPPKAEVHLKNIKPTNSTKMAVPSPVTPDCETPSTATAFLKTNPFIFPSGPIGSGANKFEEKPHPSAPTSSATPSGGSPQSNARKTGVPPATTPPSGDTAGDKTNKQKLLQRKASRRMSPSSSSEQESPSKPRRRRSSAFQQGPTFMFDRDKSPSLSSRASLRRKLSTTGRETGKIPWCACWGNGCF